MRLTALLLVAACSGAEMDGNPTCTGEKCDLPTDPADVSCRLRRSEATSKGQPGFTAAALRWSCNDARGVTAEDRGQEYCEYFAIVKPPGEAAPRVLGRNLGATSRYGTTPTGLSFTAPQVSALEKDSAAVVGQCVFTTWNSDVDMPVAAGLAVAGVAVTAEDFRMKFEVNSAEAGQNLVGDCFVAERGGDADPFTRGCLLDEDLNGTAFRKSDTTVCAAAMRMAECGCRLRGGAKLPAALSPATVRGFALGTWSSATALPPSCRYVDPGDGSRTLVACDLTAADALAGAADEKTRCKEKYADNVVVHVAVPAADLTCSPPAGGPHSQGCSAQPWVL